MDDTQKKITIEQTCFCGTKTQIVVSVKSFQEWQHGKLAQYAFPELSSTRREVLISGTCRQCQITLFGENDE